MVGKTLTCVGVGMERNRITGFGLTTGSEVDYSVRIKVARPLT